MLKMLDALPISTTATELKTAFCIAGIAIDTLAEPSGILDLDQAQARPAAAEH
jgi:hypothetical protein